MKRNIESINDLSQEEINMEIEGHKKAAEHHQALVQRHLDIVNHYSNGDREKAYELAAQPSGHEILLPTYNLEDKNQHAAM